MTAEMIPITDPGVAAFAAEWPPIEVDDETRAWTTARAAELLAERDARADLHRERITRTARWVGREVALGHLTIDQAARRIDAQINARDETHPIRVFVVPLSEGHKIAERAFARGVLSARKATR